MSDRRKYLVRIVVLLISVALSLIIGEITARVAGLAPEIIPINTRENQAFKISSNPVLGYELRENALYSDMEHGIGNKTNSHGQWDRERKYEKPAGIRRIILLGDSIVLAGDVFEMSDGMSARLEKILGEDRFEVLNFGVTGYCTKAEAELLRVKGMKYDPDIVILMFSWNDYSNRNNDLARINYARGQLTERLFRNSHLFRFAALALNLFHFRDQVDYSGITMGYDTAYAKHRIAVGNNNVEQGLKILSELSASHGFRLLITVWPQFGPERIYDIEGRDPRNCYSVSEGASLHIEGLAAKLGIPVYRLSEYFIRDFKNSPGRNEDIYGYYTVRDGMHPNSNGCRVAAEIMAKILEKNGYLRD